MKITEQIKNVLSKFASRRVVATLQIAIAVVSLIQAVKTLRKPEDNEPETDE